MAQESKTERSVYQCRSLIIILIPVGIDVPIIPGIMPIQTYSSFCRLTKLCGTRVPLSLSSALKPISVSLISFHKVSQTLSRNALA
jgi:5,10-methylenetetrahydrofolate reductase